MQREQVTIGVIESIESKYFDEYMHVHFELNERKRCDGQKKLDLNQKIEQLRVPLVECRRQVCESLNKIETLKSDMVKQNDELKELDVKWINVNNEQTAKQKELINLENDLANLNKSKHQMLTVSNDMHFNVFRSKRSRKAFTTVNIVSVYFIVCGVQEFNFLIIFWIFTG